jgi:hypothetical protein
MSATKNTPIRVWVCISKVIWEYRPKGAIFEHMDELEQELQLALEKPVTLRWYDPKHHWSSAYTQQRAQCNLHLLWFYPSAMDNEFRKYIEIGKGALDEMQQFEGYTYIAYRRATDQKFKLYDYSLKQVYDDPKNWQQYARIKMGNQVIDNIKLRWEKSWKNDKTKQNNDLPNSLLLLS